jgi:hypothetical protein
VSGADSISVTHRQVVELTTVSLDVTQYNIHTCRCAVCGKKIRAKLSQEAKKGFGPRLEAKYSVINFVGRGIFTPSEEFI